MRASKKEKERARHKENGQDCDRASKILEESEREKARGGGGGGGGWVRVWSGKCHIHEYIMSYTNSRYELKCWWKRCMLHVWMSNGGHRNEIGLTRTHITNGDAQGSVTCMNGWWCQLHEWVMSVTWRSHVTYMNESCHLYEWVMAVTWTSQIIHALTSRTERIHTFHVMHELTLRTEMLMVVVYVTCMNKRCRLREWDMSVTWMSHVSYMTGSCHLHEWVMSRIWTSHVIHALASRAERKCTCHVIHELTLRTDILMVVVHVTYMNESCHWQKWVMSYTNSHHERRCSW